MRSLIRYPLLWFAAAFAGLLMLSAGANLAAEFGDPVARLAGRIGRGEVKLDFAADGWGYLRSLLDHLDINIDSQVLVFSKTSFQLSKISPKTPRAIFFNDSVSVGSVQQGPLFELTALDPAQGIIYYTMDAGPTDKPRFQRRFEECLNCHGPAGGLVVSSVFPSADGTPFVTGAFFWGIDHRTPIEKRWGGWYVTGTHGAVEHMGNAVAPDPEHPIDLESGAQNLLSLEKKFDTSKYLAPTSDIVALMTIEHQTRMTNLIVSASQQFRRPSQNRSTDKRLDAAIDEMVAYMLFEDEAPLSDPITGVSTFTQTFPQRGPRDKLRRSLRDFDLQTRLFRFPLSYMIYSEIFDALPGAARERVYRRLYDELIRSGRRSILEILRDTKPNLPAYWFAD